MKGQVNVAFDTDTGKIAVYGPMESQEQKNLTIKVLTAAVGIVVDYVHSPIIKPNGNAQPIVPVKAPVEPKVIH